MVLAMCSKSAKKKLSSGVELLTQSFYREEMLAIKPMEVSTSDRSRFPGGASSSSSRDEPFEAEIRIESRNI